MKSELTPSGCAVDLPDKAQKLAAAYRSGMMDVGEVRHLLSQRENQRTRRGWLPPLSYCQ